MAVKKEYEKSHRLCNVTFIVPEYISRTAKNVRLVSDFNKWDKTVVPMKKLQNGLFAESVNLIAGKKYEFRYLVDNSRWENDPEADRYIPSKSGFTENSVVIV